MATLVITLKHDVVSDTQLQGFPFVTDEAYAGAMEIDTVIVYIDLLDVPDTTVAQEQYLDSNEYVISYVIIPSKSETLKVMLLTEASPHTFGDGHKNAGWQAGTEVASWQTVDGWYR